MCTVALEHVVSVGVELCNRGNRSACITRRNGRLKLVAVQCTYRASDKSLMIKGDVVVFGGNVLLHLGELFLCGYTAPQHL